MPFFVGEECQIVTFYPLRIAQFFFAEGGVVNAEEAKRFLVDKFEYDLELIELAFEELIDAGILSYASNVGVPTPNSVELTERGVYVLKRLINSIEYLNLALQAAPMPGHFLNSGLIPVRPYNSSEFVLYNKIVSTVNFIRYLRQVEICEEERFNLAVGTTSPYSFRNYKNYNFAVCDGMSAHVIGSLENMSKRAFKTKGKLKDDLLIMLKNNMLGV